MAAVVGICRRFVQRELCGKGVLSPSFRVCTPKQTCRLRASKASGGGWAPETTGTLALVKPTSGAFEAYCVGRAENNARKGMATSATTLPSVETESEPPSERKRIKHRIPQKRASALMSQLLAEAKAAVPLELPDIKSGDALEVQMLPHKSASKPVFYRGVVIRKVNKGADSSVLLRDVIVDAEVEINIPLYSPLLKSVKVLQKAFIHQGKRKGKRVRQSRIYYIRDMDHRFYKVTGSGKLANKSGHKQ